MRHQGQYHIGILLIIVGVVFLVGRILDISIWGIIWPLALMGLGLWLLLRHKHIDSDTSINQKFIGDIRREGAWQVANEEIQIFIGDIELDMTRATIPDGVTKIRIFGFIADVDIFIPRNVGLSVSTTGFITDAKVLGQKEDKFFSGVNRTSDNYEKAKQKIQLETHFFINDLTVKQV